MHSETYDLRTFQMIIILFGDSIVFRYSHVVVVDMYTLRTGCSHIRIPQRNYRKILNERFLTILINTDDLIEVSLSSSLISERIESHTLVITIVQSFTVSGG